MPNATIAFSHGPAVVTDFGADPSGITPSDNAIAAALAAKPKGGEVHFPAGRYLITRTIRLLSPWLRITGEAKGAVYIQCNTPDISVFGTNLEKRVWNIVFERIYVDTKSDVRNITGWDFTDNLNYSVLRDCGATIRGPGSNAICCGHARNGHGPFYAMIENFSANCPSKAGTTGIKFGRDSGTGANTHRTANNWTITGGRLAGFETGFDCQGSGHTVLGMAFESCGTAINLGSNHASGKLSFGAIGCNFFGHYCEGGGPWARKTHMIVHELASGNVIMPGYVTGMHLFPEPWRYGGVDYREAEGNNQVFLGGWGRNQIYNSLAVQKGDDESVVLPTW